MFHGPCCRTARPLGSASPEKVWLVWHFHSHDPRVTSRRELPSQGPKLVLIIFPGDCGIRGVSGNCQNHPENVKIKTVHLLR